MKNWGKLIAISSALLIAEKISEPFILQKGERQSELQEKTPFIYISQNSKITAISGSVGVRNGVFK